MESLDRLVAAVRAVLPVEGRMPVVPAAARGEMLDRIADVMIAAEEIRELAERAGLDQSLFDEVDVVAQHLFRESNRLLQCLGD